MCFMTQHCVVNINKNGNNNFKIIFLSYILPDISLLIPLCFCMILLLFFWTLNSSDVLNIWPVYSCDFLEADKLYMGNSLGYLWASYNIIN